MTAQQQSPAELAQSQFRKFTYVNKDVGGTLDDNLPTHPNKHISSLSKVGLGALDAFPTEVLHCILAQLDLRSLTNFHYVNHRARHVLASLPHYEDIDTHARNVLRGILSISLGPWITLETLHQALCTEKCASCGDFGGYLYLLTCTRVCYLCFISKKSYLPQRRHQAKQRFALTSPLLKTLPQMLSRPGTYTPDGRDCLARLDLVDKESARQAGVALHGSVVAMKERVRQDTEQKWQRYRCRLASFTKSSIKSSVRRPPRTVELWDGQHENPLRFMAVVRAPWLDRSSQSVEWGAHCKGCRDLDEDSEGEPSSEESDEEMWREKTEDMPDVVSVYETLAERLYNVASFDEHLRRLGAIKKGKHCVGLTMCWFNYGSLYTLR
jgi:hypothetical protein